jgi:O-antigen/teichoic acid export membrane protein
MSTQTSLRKGLGFGAMGFGANALLAIVSSIVTARLYGVDVIGEFALVAAPGTMVWALSYAGEQVASVRHLVEYPQRHPRVTGIFFAVFAFSLVLTTVVGVAVLTIAYLLFNGPIDRPDLFAPTVVNTVACVFISTPAANLDTPMSAFMAGRELFWIRLLQAFSFIVLAVGLSFVEADVWALVIATIGSWSVSLAHRLIAVRAFVDLRPQVDELRAGLAELRQILAYGIKLVPRALSMNVSYEIGVWVLGATSSIGAVGAYNRAWTVVYRFTEANWRINEMLFPALVRRRREGDRVGFARASLDTQRYALFLTLLPASFGAGGAEAIMRIFGPGFGRASDALAILLLLPMLSMLQGIQATILFASERPTAPSVATVLQMIVTVVGTFFLTEWLGIVGPAIGLVLGFAVCVLLQSAMLRGTFDASLRSLFPPSHLLGPVVAYAVAFGVGRLCAEQVPGLILSLLAVAVAGAVAYLGVALAIARPLPRDRERIRSLLERWPGRGVATGEAL